MDQRFTRSEVERMTGATRQQLDYWARLGLVRPRARWGERFFGFSDLVAVETLRRVTALSVPAGKLRRAINALDRQLGKTSAPLAALRIAMNGNQIIVHEPGPEGRLVEPISGQYLLNFETAPLERKVRALGGRSAEQWFEVGMAADASPQTLPEAVDAYRRAIELSSEWVEAHINLGTALYRRLGCMEEAREVFARATQLDPKNALAHFNLGCMQDRPRVIPTRPSMNSRAAVEQAPNMADAHLNLALAYEKAGGLADSLNHLSLYLRYEPQKGSLRPISPAPRLRRQPRRGCKRHKQSDAVPPPQGLGEARRSGLGNRPQNYSGTTDVPEDLTGGNTMRFQLACAAVIGVISIGLALAQGPKAPPDLKLRGDRFKPLTYVEMTPEQKTLVDHVMSGPRASMDGPLQYHAAQPGDRRHGAIQLGSPSALPFLAPAEI